MLNNTSSSVSSSTSSVSSTSASKRKFWKQFHEALASDEIFEKEEARRRCRLENLGRRKRDRGGLPDFGEALSLLDEEGNWDPLLLEEEEEAEEEEDPWY